MIQTEAANAVGARPATSLDGRTAVPASAPRGQHTATIPQFLTVCAALAGSLLLRLSLFHFQSGDYRAFLGNWYDHFVQEGRWHGIGTPADQLTGFCYPPLYPYLVCLSTLLPIPKLYAIKMLSLSADYLAAWYAWKLVWRDGQDRRRAWGAVILLLILPTVVMNSALWGQCDMMYACGLLASLYYFLVGRSVAGLVAFGLAFSVKPQAMFWCTFLAVLLFSGRLPWKWIWVPLAVYVGSGVPAVLAGRALLDVLTQWTSAAVSQPALTLGAPNWYQWWPGAEDPILYWGGAGLALLVAEALIFALRQGPRRGANAAQWLVAVALLSVLFPPFLLPGMHERYFFAADVLSLVYAFLVPAGWRVAVLVQAASAGSYLAYLFGIEPVPRAVLALLILAAIALVVKELLARRTQDWTPDDGLRTVGNGQGTIDYGLPTND